jgi:hypothetical protein
MKLSKRSSPKRLRIKRKRSKFISKCLLQAVLNKKMDVRDLRRNRRKEM